LSRSSEVRPGRHRATDLSEARVSVIIPAHNARAYLAQAIESALNQTLPPAEVIVVDDGSTDGTQDVMESYLGRVSYQRQANLGVSAARNAGLAAASGEFVAFLDADDFFLPWKLASQVEILRSHPGQAFVNSGWRVVDAQGQLLREVEPWREAPKLDLLTWLRWKPVFPGALLLRRDALEQAGGFDPRLKHAEDVDLVLRLAVLGFGASWLEASSVCYRQHSGNVSHARSDQAAGIVEVLTSFFARPGLSRAVRRKEASIWYSTYLWAAWGLYSAGQLSDAEEYLRRSLRYAKGGREVAALDWAGAFARFARREGQEPGGVRSAIPVFQRAAGADGDLAPIVETALRFRLEILESSFSTGGLPGTAALEGFRSLSPRQLLKTVQSALVSSPSAVGPARVARFWEAMLRAGLVPRSAERDVTTLYLTLFTRAVFNHQWQAVLEAGWHALRVGLHPRALPAWGRFIRSAVQYLLTRSSGGSATTAIWHGAHREGHQTPMAPR
jgi:glycosyltransferase involved in cell wall biosynthesis